MANYPDVFTLDDEDLLTTDIELIEWFEEEENRFLKGFVTFENYIPLSEYEQTYQERRYIRYYE